MSFEGLDREELVALLNELLEGKASAERQRSEESEGQAQLLHELQVYQVELEVQNRELREAQDALEQSRDRHAELYDFAPAAYVTLDENYAVRALNLKAAALFGTPRTGVVGRSFLKLACRVDSESCLRLFERARSSTLGVDEEVSLSIAGESQSVRMLIDASVEPSSGRYEYRCAMVDVTERVRAEGERDRAYAAERVLHRRFELLDQVNLALSTLLATPERIRVEAVLETVADQALSVFEAVEVELKLDAEEPLHVLRRREALSPDAPWSALQIPVRLGSRPLGMLTLRYDGADPRALKESQLTLELLADRLALALESVRLNRKEAEERASLSLLEYVSHELSTCHDSLSTEAALGRSVRALVPDFGAAAMMYVSEANGHRPIAITHLRGGVTRLLSQIAQPLAERLPSLLERDAAYAIVPLAELDPRPQLSRVLAVASVIVLPLVTRQVRHGFLVLGRDASRAVPHAVLETLARFAESCAWALERAKLLEQLRTAVESRDTLLAIVSHDLRSPLNAILLTARSLASVPPERERRRSGAQVALIQRSVARMGSLIEDLLTANALDADQFRLDAGVQVASDLVLEACQLNQPQIEVAGLSIEQRVADDLPYVWADRQRVLQVLTNLLGNALKFTPRGGQLIVRADACAEGVRFAVTDTGPGIPVHQLDRVFDRYWSGKERRNGLGLGLFIAQRMVAAHGGRIWVESTFGAGATFFFTLPTPSGKSQVAAVHGSLAQVRERDLTGAHSQS